MSLSQFFHGPLYQRMSDDLQLAGMSQRTHDGYLRAIRQLADFCETPPDRITEDQLREFFLHLKVDRNFAPGSLRVALSGLKFFFGTTCLRTWQTLDTLKIPTFPDLARSAHPGTGSPDHQPLPYATYRRLSVDRLLDGTQTGGRAESAGW